MAIDSFGDALGWTQDTDWIVSHIVDEAAQTAVETTLLDPRDEKKTIEAESLLTRMSTQEPMVMATTAVKSIKASVKHRLIGINAQLDFFESRPCPLRNRTSWAKGWFAPYLYSSGRTPHISRSEDFAFAQCLGPALEADSKVAHALWAENATVIQLCSPLPTDDIGSRRMVLSFTGISPWRLSAWSQSRQVSS